MNPKTVGIVIFGMCISFCAIFLTLSYLAEGPPPRDRELGRIHPAHLSCPNTHSLIFT